MVPAGNVGSNKLRFIHIYSHSTNKTLSVLHSSRFTTASSCYCCCVWVTRVPYERHRILIYPKKDQQIKQDKQTYEPTLKNTQNGSNKVIEIESSQKDDCKDNHSLRSSWTNGSNIKKPFKKYTLYITHTHTYIYIKKIYCLFYFSKKSSSSPWLTPTIKHCWRHWFFLPILSFPPFFKVHSVSFLWMTTLLHVILHACDHIFL